MKILQAPNPILSAPTQPVRFANGQLPLSIKRLIEQMKQTLLAVDQPKAVGLSANQIGHSVQIFIIKPWPKAKIQVFLNPEIVSRSRQLTNGVPERENKLEGCLSIKDVWGLVRRSQWLKLKYWDEKGKLHRRLFKGFKATIIQHELDHLNGRLFTERCLEQGNKVYTSKSVTPVNQD